MSVRTLIITFLFFFNIIIFAGEISGKVVDSKGKTVENAKIEILKYNIKVNSNKYGEFSINLENKKIPFVIYVFKDEFLPYSKKITRNVENLTIILQKIPKLSENITVNPVYVDEEENLIPIPHNTVYSEVIFNQSPNIITDVLKSNNDVDVIGQGGVSITPSIRGMARRRVLALLDGVRIVSDRRVGSSISFVNPDSISFIDVIKSPSSVLFGSDAIGGVINLYTKNSVEGEFDGILRTKGGSNTYGLGLSKLFKFGDFSYFVDVQKNKSNDYSSPNGKIFNSSYTANWIKLGILYKKNDLDFKFSIIDGTLRNVGKPDRKNDELKYTFNPKDENKFFNFNLNKDKFWILNNLNLEFSYNPTEYLLKKVDKYKISEEFSKTLADNYTFSISFNEKISEVISFQYGIQWFFRRNLEILNQKIENNLTQSFSPLENGKRDDKSVFSTLTYKLDKNMIIAGLRFTDIALSGISNGNYNYRNEDSLTYFLAYSRKINDKLSLYSNNSKAFREPSLSELFYTGISGRKYIIGNKNLNSEKSNNFDIGFNFETDKLMVKLGYFQNTVENLIERYEVEDGIYTFDNINKGRIKGFEVSGFVKLCEKISTELMYRNYSGKSLFDSQYLNDIPANTYNLKNRISFNKGFISINLFKSFSKSDVGPSEVENSDYLITSINGSYYHSEKLFFSFNFHNIFNRLYYQNADPDAPYNPGRTFTINLHYLF